MGAAAAQLAGWALALQRKLEGVPEDLDEGWRDEVLGDWAFLDVLQPSHARRVLPRLVAGRLGAWPALGRMDDPLARLCLLSRPALLNRLCTLALARRPGVLRCCIDRPLRSQLQQALGDSFVPLLAMSRGSRPVDADTAAWAPLIWACIGFTDWSACLLPGDAALHALVRWSLPRDVLDGLADQLTVPAEATVAAALGGLSAAGVTWPC